MNDSVGVDHIAHKHLIAPLVRLDLITDSGFSLLMELVSNPNCMYVHFAPPCGTASRARDIQRHGQRMPARARSDEHPDGLPDLEPSLPTLFTKPPPRRSRPASMLASWSAWRTLAEATFGKRLNGVSLREV